MRFVSILFFFLLRGFCRFENEISSPALGLFFESASVALTGGPPTMADGFEVAESAKCENRSGEHATGSLRSV